MKLLYDYSEQLTYPEQWLLRVLAGKL